MLVLAHELDSCVKPNLYCTASRAHKTLPNHNSLGILRPNFQLLYKKINYQCLTIFDQIESQLQLFLYEALCIVSY